MVKGKVNMIGMLLYWAGCAYILVGLAINDTWQQFYDSSSLIVSFLPACLTFFISGSLSVASRIGRALRVMWLSSAMMAVYGLIYASGNILIDKETFVVGLSVAMLPILYALSAHLIVLPLTWRSISDESSATDAKDF